MLGHFACQFDLGESAREIAGALQDSLKRFRCAAPNGIRVPKWGFRRKIPGYAGIDNRQSLGISKEPRFQFFDRDAIEHDEPISVSRRFRDQPCRGSRCLQPLLQFVTIRAVFVNEHDDAMIVRQPSTISLQSLFEFAQQILLALKRALPGLWGEIVLAQG